MSVYVERDQQFLEQIRAIGTDVAAAYADAVDRERRFPQESLDALREVRALSAGLPEQFGGGGVSFPAVAAACTELGRHCGSSAMVFAMHQIKVLTLARHVEGAAWFPGYLERVGAEQRLVASVTSEIGTGGDMGRSIAALGLPDGGLSSFEKQAPTVSYGAHADDFFITLRRTPDAEESDQVVALALDGQVELEPAGEWDTLGMRGTCSPGFVIRGAIAPEQTLADPFATVMAESIVPVTHLLWSHLWLGIAEDAFDRARAFVRAAARRKPGQTPPEAVRLSHLMSELSLLRAEVASALDDFVRIEASGDRSELSTMASMLRFNNLKIAASEQSARVCQEALGVCGIMGFRNGTPFSVGRHLRDSLSASLMIANERIHNTNASLLLIAKDV
jgi:acyl-CoA dehydrogenase